MDLNGIDVSPKVNFQEQETICVYSNLFQDLVKTSATSGEAGDDLQHELVDPVNQELLKTNQFAVNIMESLLPRQQSGTAAGLFRCTILLASK